MYTGVSQRNLSKTDELDETTLRTFKNETRKKNPKEKAKNLNNEATS